MEIAENKGVIQISNVEVIDGKVEPYMHYVLQDGNFCDQDNKIAEKAKEAAQMLADKLKSVPWTSPFDKHSSIIMADYYTAAKLKRFVLSLWKGITYPEDFSYIAGMDKKHFGIVVELMTSYHVLG